MAEAFPDEEGRLIVRTLSAENVTGPVAIHGEGPVWSETWGGLRWVDMLSGTLLTLRSGRIDRLDIHDPIAAFVRPRRAGGYVVATERGVALAEHPDESPERHITLWDDPAIRMNDGTTTPDGLLLAGSMGYDASPGRGTLHLVRPDLSTSVLLPEVTISNGIGFSPDGTLAYYNDSLSHQVQVFDYRAGELYNGRTFVSIDAEIGLPDGLTVAADGSVWVAIWGGSAVHGYSPAGELLARVDLPVSQVSACTLGGPELDTLFITTSRQGLADGEQPEAGSVFAVRPGCVGLSVVTFNG